MRVLITGATGYLGARVAAALAAAGHEVRGLCRRGSEVRLPAGCVAVHGDLLDAGSLPGAIAGCDAVVHMAAMVQKWVPDRGAFDRVNVGGTRSILEAAAAGGVRRVLYTSSIVALGPTEGRPEDEDWSRRDFAHRTEYERTKWLALLAVRERIAAGEPIVVVYPGVVYGPGASTEGNHLGPMLSDHLHGRLKMRLGRSDLKICYAFAEDVARGHLLALERGVPGRGYVLGGENATQAELFSVLRELSGRRAPRLVIPYWMGEALGSASTLAAWLTGRPPALTRGVVSTFRHEWAYSSARAVRELGYSITPLNVGLRRTLEMLRRTG